MDSNDVQLLIRKLGSIEHILYSKLSSVENYLLSIEKRIASIEYDVRTIKRVSLDERQ